MSGAGSRPDANYVWNQIRNRLQLNQNAPYDNKPLLSSKDLSWFHFLVLLVAHGWFIRPRAFPLARKEDPQRVRPKKMMARVYLFISAWLFLLVAFPLKWVVTGFLVWVLILIPGLIEIHRQFQNEK